MIYKLNDICDFLSGNAWKSSKFQDAGIPIVRINNMNFNDKEFVYWQDDYDDKYIIKEGDLLLSLSGTIKIFKWNGPSALLNQRIVKITAKKLSDVNIDWVYYHLNYGIEIIANKGKDAGIKNVSINDLKDFEVDIPDIQTQNKVVAILDKANFLVKKREKMIQTLDQLLRNIFLDMFQPDLIDFKNSNITLSQIASIVSGLTKGRKTKESNLQETPYLRVANVQDGYFNLGDIKTISATEREVQQYAIEKGDLLITEGGDSDKLGRGSVWEEEKSKFIYQNHLFRLRIRNLNEYSPYWLIQLINSEFGKYYFQRQAKQTTGIATINKRQVSNFPIPASPFFKQKEFEKYYLLIKDNKKILSSSLVDFKILLSSINQRAFNGQLNFNIDLELDALINEIDIQKSYNDLSGIERDNVYLQRLIDKLNGQEFKEKALYDKAKHGIFQLMAAQEKRVIQKYDEETQSLKLVLK